jgi:signal transduction histidine kinase
MSKDAMKTAPHHFTVAALALGASSVPGIAANTAAPTIIPSSVFVTLLWLLLLGWGFHALLRRHLSFIDGIAETDRQLGLERHARGVAERALADTHSALCRLVEQQEHVRESERNRIARDIHDDLGQNLLALKIELSLMQVSTNGAHPLINQKIGGMIRNLDVTIKSLRVIINDLRPLALEAGLQNAMQWQLNEFSRINGIRHELEADPEVFQLHSGRGQDLDAMLFRILQESLSNVVRHANATEVKIALNRSADQLTLTVHDNGVGMAGQAPAYGCGLLGIKDRVTAIGGRFAIDSRPGGGTLLSLSIPLAQPIAEH